MRIHLVFDPRSPSSIDESRKIARHMLENDFDVSIDSRLPGFKLDIVPLEKTFPKLIVAVGDDGLFLKTFSRIEKKIPVLPVNTGNVGFLASIESYQFRDITELLKKKKYLIEIRKRMETEVNGRKYLALNDFVITPEVNGCILHYTLKIDNEFVLNDGADGVIMATPTGSTAYSMSAGGPMIGPEVDAFIVNTLASINQTAVPHIISDSRKITIENIYSKCSCILIVDGHTRLRLGKKLKFRKSNRPSYIITFDNAYSRLNKRLKKKIDVFEKDTDSLEPTERLVYTVLYNKGPLALDEIAGKIEESPERIKEAIKILKIRNLVFEKNGLFGVVIHSI